MLGLDLLRTRRNEILKLADCRGATNLRVFGLVARGQAGEASDLDLIVEIDQCRTAPDLCGLMVDLEDAFGAPVHIVEMASPPDPLLAKVLPRSVAL